jgi:hypothetical protein
MSQTTFKITGSAGRLRAGSRLAATLGAWKARHVEGERWQFTFDSFEPDPYWFEHGSAFRLTLAMGSGEIVGRCEIVNRDPLILEMEISA